MKLSVPSQPIYAVPVPQKLLLTCTAHSLWQGPGQASFKPWGWTKFSLGCIMRLNNLRAASRWNHVFMVHIILAMMHHTFEQPGRCIAMTSWQEWLRLMASMVDTWRHHRLLRHLGEKTGGTIVKTCWKYRICWKVTYGPFLGGLHPLQHMWSNT